MAVGVDFVPYDRIAELDSGGARPGKTDMPRLNRLIYPSICCRLSAARRAAMDVDMAPAGVFEDAGRGQFAVGIFAAHPQQRRPGV